jgi:hypothetical protein
MTIEEEITALLDKAEPLRCLPEDEPAKAPLAGIITEINRLRAIQAAPGYVPAKAKK